MEAQHSHNHILRAHLKNAMFFIDGTNFLNCLREKKLKSGSIQSLARSVSLGRQLVRTYFYTTAEKLEKAREVHGPGFPDGCRIVLVDSIPLGNGKFREKGVDALLVADLVYHVAQKNCVYAVAVSNDSDFAHAISRVEDFGCKTGILAIGTHAAERLQGSCDDYRFTSTETMIEHGWASVASKANQTTGDCQPHQPDKD